MSHFTGSAAYIEFRGVAMNTDYRNFDPDRKIDKTETTAGADTDKSYLPTIRDGTVKMTFVQDNSAAGTAVVRNLYEGAAGTLRWGTEGTATGMPKYECEAFVESLTAGLKYNEATLRDVTWQKTGAWISNYDISGSVW